MEPKTHSRLHWNHGGGHPTPWAPREANDLVSTADPPRRRGPAALDVHYRGLAAEEPTLKREAELATWKGHFPCPGGAAAGT